MRHISDGNAGGRAFYRGLRVRIACLLALSLLPLGLVMGIQTRALSDDAAVRSEMHLLSLSGQASFGERSAIERAFGAAEALTGIMELFADTQNACRTFVQSYVASSKKVSSLGFIDRDGIVRCSSAEAELDYRSDPLFLRLLDAPTPYIARIDSPDVTREPVLNLVLPVEVDDNLRGFLSVSVPVRHAEGQGDIYAGMAPLSLLTFNRDGDILTSESGAAQGPILPKGLNISTLVGGQTLTFDELDESGVARTFAVLPIVPNLHYALAAWPVEQRSATLAGIAIPPVLLPLLMFAASIAVSYFAVDRLVVRHIGALRRMMQAFARDRVVPSRATQKALPSELGDLQEGFLDMASILSRDEARMENALREKSVLLKEVHHRVKNNLQLISSIMNMQIRTAQHDETVQVLRRMQERLLGLATVHQNLYQTDDLSRTDAGKLLEDLFDQLLAMTDHGRDTIRYVGKFDAVILDPDQALPLCLLASELGTNALKHVGTAESGPRLIEASLQLVGDGDAELICESSTATGKGSDRDPSDDLTARLIGAFAWQLGGKVRTTTEGRRHRAVLRFKVEAFAKATGDY